MLFSVQMKPAKRPIAGRALCLAGAAALALTALIALPAAAPPAFAQAESAQPAKKPAPKTSRKSRAKPAPAPAPEPPPAPPSDVPATYSFEPLGKAAEAYAAFQSDVTALKAMTPKNVEDSEAALTRIASQNPAQVARGWIAYGALTAARTPSFAAEVRKLEKINSGDFTRDRVIRGFASGSSWPLQLDPTGAASRDVIQALLATAKADSDRIEEQGARYRQLGLELSKARWARTDLTRGKTARMARLRAASASYAPNAFTPEQAVFFSPPAGGGGVGDPVGIGGSLFWEAFAAGPSYAAPMSYPLPQELAQNNQHQQAVNHMSSLAALYIMGATTQAPMSAIDRLLDESAAKNCFESAMSQFLGCVSSVKFHNEAIACVGEAGLQTRARCVRNLVGAANVTPISTTSAMR
jgi:hypothetical protein